MACRFKSQVWDNLWCNVAQAYCTGYQENHCLHKKQTEHEHCPYCEAENNDFIPLNQTAEYSGIEMMLNRQGMLRVRYYTHNDRELYETQDIVNVIYCPNCGAKMDGGATE